MSPDGFLVTFSAPFQKVSDHADGMMKSLFRCILFLQYLMVADYDQVFVPHPPLGDQKDGEGRVCFE